MVQVVRFCHPAGKWVSLKSPDTIPYIHSKIHHAKLKSSARYSKVYISSDMTPKERIRHKELVEELKKKIQVDSSKHWKIIKGGVTFFLN